MGVLWKECYRSSPGPWWEWCVNCEVPFRCYCWGERLRDQQDHRWLTCSRWVRGWCHFDPGEWGLYWGKPAWISPGKSTQGHPVTRVILCLHGLSPSLSPRAPLDLISQDMGWLGFGHTPDNPVSENSGPGQDMVTFPPSQKGNNLTSPETFDLILFPPPYPTQCCPAQNPKPCLLPFLTASSTPLSSSSPVLFSLIPNLGGSVPAPERPDSQEWELKAIM